MARLPNLQRAGIAPGLTNLMTADAASRLERVHSVRIRIGEATFERAGGVVKNQPTCV